MSHKDLDANIRNFRPVSPRFPGSTSIMMALALGLAGCGDDDSMPRVSNRATRTPASMPAQPKISSATKPEIKSTVSNIGGDKSLAATAIPSVTDYEADLAIPEGQLKAGQVLHIEAHLELSPMDVDAAANGGEVRTPGLLLDATIAHVPLRQALTALGEKLDAKVSVAPTLPDTEITAEFSALPVEDGIKRILADQNFMVIRSNPAPGTVFQDRPESGNDTMGKLAAAGEERITEIRVLDKNRTSEQPEELAELSDDGKAKELGRLAMKAVNGKTAEVRLSALKKYLDKAPPGEVLGTVLQTMKDSDSKVRRKALGSFAMAVRDPNDRHSLNAIAEVALGDADPATRTSALGAMFTAYGAQAGPLLEQALDDPDPGVRTAARESLETLGAIAKQRNHAGAR